MKKIIMGMVCIALLSMSSFAYSDKGAYFSGSLGLAMPSDIGFTDTTTPGVVTKIEQEFGLTFGVAIGYDFDNHFRIEAEVVQQKNDFDEMSLQANATGSSSSRSLLFNGYYDFPSNGAFTPFFSIGIGFSEVEIEYSNFQALGISRSSIEDTVFAHQIGVGLAYALTERASLDIKYRYMGVSGLDFGALEVDYTTHNLYAGIRLDF